MNIIAIFLFKGEFCFKTENGEQIIQEIAINGEVRVSQVQQLPGEFVSIATRWDITSCVLFNTTIRM